MENILNKLKETTNWNSEKKETIFIKKMTCSRKNDTSKFYALAFHIYIKKKKLGYELG